MLKYTHNNTNTNKIKLRENIDHQNHAIKYNLNIEKGSYENKNYLSICHFSWKS